MDIFRFEIAAKRVRRENPIFQEHLSLIIHMLSHQYVYESVKLLYPDGVMCICTENAIIYMKPKFVPLFAQLICSPSILQGQNLFRSVFSHSHDHA